MWHEGEIICSLLAIYSNEILSNIRFKICQILNKSSKNLPNTKKVFDQVQNLAIFDHAVNKHFLNKANPGLFRQFLSSKQHFALS